MYRYTYIYIYVCVYVTNNKTCSYYLVGVRSGVICITMVVSMMQSNIAVLQCNHGSGKGIHPREQFPLAILPHFPLNHGQRVEGN